VDAVSGGRRALAMLVLLASAALAGCVAHPVGPARTFDAYEAKARTTAESARSSVATVHLLVETAANGDLFGTYASVTVSEQEDAINGVEGTFASIQPPDGESEAVRSELLALLSDASEHVSAVRIEVRRGHLDGLDRYVADLTSDEAALTAFLEAHGAES
jgi:hypothetical protein